MRSWLVVFSSGRLRKELSGNRSRRLVWVRPAPVIRVPAASLAPALLQV